MNNFLPEDRSAAARLLDGVTLVRLSTMRHALLKHLDALVADGLVETPAVLIPALSINDIPTTNERHIAYRTYTVGGPIAALPGSEGFIGNVVRQLLAQQTERRRWMDPASSLEALRRGRCRSIVLVTDYAGSGTQLVEFARTFVRNEAIRSWRSGARVRVHAVAYAASTAASSRIRRLPGPIDMFWPLGPAPTFDDRAWSDTERAEIEQLCLSRSTSGNRSDALGYKSSRGLFAMESGAPNNLPWILRRPSSEHWSSFFDRRSVPSELVAQLGDYSPDQVDDRLEQITGQVRLSARLLERSAILRPVTAEMLKVLALLRTRRMDELHLAAIMALELPRTRELLKALTHLGLISVDLRVTPRGAAELDAAKRAQRHTLMELPEGVGEYYPKGMR